MARLPDMINLRQCLYGQSRYECMLLCACPKPTMTDSTFIKPQLCSVTGLEIKLQVFSKKVEFMTRWILITLRDKKRNEWIRNQTKVYDITSVRLKKWTWEGHLARRNDKIWTSRITTRRPWLGKKKQMPTMCEWIDYITGFVEHSKLVSESTR